MIYITPPFGVYGIANRISRATDLRSTNKSSTSEGGNVAMWHKRAASGAFSEMGDTQQRHYHTLLEELRVWVGRNGEAGLAAMEIYVRHMPRRAEEQAPFMEFLLALINAGETGDLRKIAGA